MWKYLLASIFLFFISNDSEVLAQDKVKSDSSEVYKFVEVSPEFPGGNEGLRNFIASNINYPKNSVSEGLVIVSFVVDEQGKVKGIKITRSLSPETDAEAFRVISLMPNWKAGTNNGQPVKVKVNIPLRFSPPELNISKKKKSKSKPKQ